MDLDFRFSAAVARRLWHGRGMAAARVWVRISGCSCAIDVRLYDARPLPNWDSEIARFVLAHIHVQRDHDADLTSNDNFILKTMAHRFLFVGIPIRE